MITSLQESPVPAS